MYVHIYSIPTLVSRSIRLLKFARKKKNNNKIVSKQDLHYRQMRDEKEKYTKGAG